MPLSISLLGCDNNKFPPIRTDKQKWFGINILILIRDRWGRRRYIVDAIRQIRTRVMQHTSLSRCLSLWFTIFFSSWEGNQYVLGLTSKVAVWLEIRLFTMRYYKTTYKRTLMNGKIGKPSRYISFTVKRKWITPTRYSKLISWGGRYQRLIWSALALLTHWTMWIVGWLWGTWQVVLSFSISSYSAYYEFCIFLANSVRLKCEWILRDVTRPNVVVVVSTTPSPTRLQISVWGPWLQIIPGIPHRVDVQLISAITWMNSV